jgi:hypothetical protein
MPIHMLREMFVAVKAATRCERLVTFASDRCTFKNLTLWAHTWEVLSVSRWDTGIVLRCQDVSITTLDEEEILYEQVLLGSCPWMRLNLGKAWVTSLVLVYCTFLSTSCWTVIDVHIFVRRLVRFEFHDFRWSIITANTHPLSCLVNAFVPR